MKILKNQTIAFLEGSAEVMKECCVKDLFFCRSTGSFVYI
jgi:hypothetical protein